MLRAPINKLRLFRMRYFLIILTCFAFSTLIIAINLNADILPNTGSYFDPLREQDTFLSAADSSNFFLNALIIIIPLVAGIFMMFYHIPGFTSIGLSKAITIREFKLTRYGLPQRGYTIVSHGVKIRITKKFSSLKGLLLQEFLLAIYLPKNYSETKRLYDFLACEDVTYSSEHKILKKTIKARDTPLHIIRTRALLSVLQ